MRTILCVIPTLEYSGAAKQIALLAAGLPRDRFAVHVAALSGDGPAAAPLGAAGAVVEALGQRRLIDLAALWRLRRLVRALRPDTVHAWGLPALRAMAVTAGRGPSQLVVSNPFSPGDRRTGPGRLDRWLLRRVDRIIAQGPAEAERCQGFGLPPGKVVVVPPGVESDPGTRRPRNPATGEQAPGRLLACVGPLEPSKGFPDAFWACDVLQFIYDDLSLLLIGSGSDRDRLERVAQGINPAHRVRFVGDQADAAGLLAGAAVVCVPSWAEGGLNVALEAMALGRVVVASRLPGLAEIVIDGKTGLLVTPGDKIELARRIRRLLDDDVLRRQLGEAGRQRAAAHFAAADLVRRCADLYQAQQAA